MASHDPTPEQRESCLPMALAGMIVAFCAVALLLVTFGWVLYLLLALLVLGAFVGFHYLLWGRALAGEVEQERLRRLAESGDEDDADPPPWQDNGPPRDSYRPRF
jgi:fatty acid desaturase